MDDTVGRIAAVQRQHIWYFVGNLGVPGMPDNRGYKCNCGWSTGDPDEPGFEDPHAHVAAAVLKALELTERFAVSSGERRQFDQFDTRDGAERGLHCVLTNNEHWQAKGREIPVWARDPHIESRLVGPWERVRGDS